LFSHSIPYLELTLLDVERPRDPASVRVSEAQAAVVRQLFA
jgi:hypothetical protein